MGLSPDFFFHPISIPWAIRRIPDDAELDLISGILSWGTYRLEEMEEIYLLWHE